MIIVKDEKALAKAIKDGQDSIYVEGDLKNKIIRIKVTGKVAWAVCFAAIAAAVALYFITPAATVTTGGIGGAISFTGSTAIGATAVTILGVKATTVAISLAIVAGGCGVLTSLRNNYKISRKDHNGILLQKK